MMSKNYSKYRTRIDSLSQTLNADQILLLSTPTDIAYLTGFIHLVPEERESFLLVTPHTHLFFHASFSPFNIPSGIIANRGSALSKIEAAIQDFHQQNKIKELLVDKSSLFVNEFEMLTKLSFLKVTGFDRQHIWNLRTIKDDQEIATLANAAQITAQAMEAAIDALQAGMTEIELRTIIEAQLRKLGSEKPAFPTIVAFGANSALPHHQPTTVALQPEMAVLIDMGATIAGYHGDMTRTIWFGQKPDPEFLKIEAHVKNAYQTAVRVLKNRKVDQQILAKDLDQAARGVISSAGYGEKFIHTTGHGLGLDLHENLSLNWNNTQKIRPQMVITIEPGIYVEGRFGYRHENMILVTTDDAQELMK